MRVFVICVFCVSVVCAVFLNMTREEHNIQTHLLDSSRPKIKVKNFMVLSYGVDDLKSSTFVSQGELLESGVFKAANGVKSLKFDTNETTNLFANRATVKFLSENIDELLSKPEYNEITLEDDILLNFHGLSVSGEVVYYDNIKKVLYTSDPVKIKGIGKWATSRDGFVYDLQAEKLSMKGRVEGAFGSQ